MARFVIGPDVALHLAEIDAAIPAKHKLLAPTLLRSQVLALLYEAVRRGDIDRKGANAKLDYLRSLKLRLLGDRVLQRVAWDIAQQLDWPDTYQAEYLALTRLQADAFITLDRDLAQTAQAIIPVASIEDLLNPPD
ncbi:type II toxin-antitoxin system VapC family toxin [Phyllobacterium sp. BT25]|uniref:Type II toxin-antitoxin system VapC family toxin n=1 Tax=Phyllobacterium pellucidum TaxID=2740464 RepID=A0A849W179_9HYPH|nr:MULTISPECIES: type II toxin-antitoxin system VapC family toxin [Phyllobacterium]NTS33840.1 type II toxin-antitoxin system VapC family toxin [Phyllobacterium pellucidum]UGY08699.1 type II toxin-antitoxin system VapC family toxin [Phyllobacterium sp. T1018]